MSPTLTRIVLFLVVFAVCGALSTGSLHRPLLHFSFQPIATILILAIPLTQHIKHPSSFALWISVGLFFSLFGDVFLLFHDRCFLFGLSAFLLAHISYLIAFTRDVSFPARLSVWLIYFAVVGCFVLFVVFPKLPSGLRLPIIVYMFFVVSMAAQSMGRFLILKNIPAGLAAFGAIFFVLSDSLLAFDRFQSPIPAAAFFVLIPYYIAQWSIALSTQPSSSKTSVIPTGGQTPSVWP